MLKNIYILGDFRFTAAKRGDKISGLWNARYKIPKFPIDKRENWRYYNTNLPVG